MTPQPKMVILASAQRDHGTTGDLHQLAHSLFDVDFSDALDTSDENVLDSITAALQARPRAPCVPIKLSVRPLCGNSELHLSTRKLGTCEILAVIVRP